MIRIGIDYSLNSPSICIDNNGELVFMSFFNTEGAEWDRPNPLKKFSMHNRISGFVKMFPYTRHKTEKGCSYADEQRLKMTDAEMISGLITNAITPYAEMHELKFQHETPFISLEGFAFASSGAAFIDLIMFNSFLRKNLIENFGTECIGIVAPASAKKLAGKGNADKEFMIKAFINNTLSDKSLEETGLWKHLRDSEIDFKNIKPLDDIVDSYFIMKAQTK